MTQVVLRLAGELAYAQFQHGLVGVGDGKTLLRALDQADAVVGNQQLQLQLQLQLQQRLPQ